MHKRKVKRRIKISKLFAKFRHFHLSYKIILACSGLVVAIVLTGIGLRATESHVHTSLTGNTVVPVKKSITIRLHQDLKVAKARVTLTPADTFDYKFTGAGVGETDLVITPTKAFKNNQEYAVAVSNLQHLFTQRGVPLQTIHFHTELAPGIASFTPGNTQVTRDASFTLVASDHAMALRKYTLSLEPKVEMKASFDGHATWRWKPTHPLPQGTQFKVLLSANQKPLQQTSLQVVSEPKVTAATAKDHFYPGDKITVTFDKPMRTDAKAMVNFTAIPGKGAWQNNTTYIFTPDKLQPNKTYDYTFKAGFTSKDGGVVEGDQKFTITTPGPTTVTSISPGGSGVRRNAPILFTFDQPVDHASAEAHFSIAPAIKGTFQWNNNTLTFIPSGYDFQTTYVATINPGVVATYGVPGIAPASGRFTTELETLKLPVPAFSQTMKLSCEAAALRMALAFYGVQTSDMALVQAMGYSPRSYDNGQWDDPYTQFVGNVNGKQWDRSGYGAYAPPVAAAARSAGRNASAFFGVSASFISQQIHDGHPVVVWGYEFNPTAFSWHTPSGKEIQAWQGEHTRTVIGVVGNTSAPAGFYVTDPASGATRYWSAGSLTAQLNVHGSVSNQAVVVY
jgi:uncharacterized protein YvpB